MGGGSWKSDNWSSYRRSSGMDRATSAHDIYKSSYTKKEYLPKGVVRESCDSDEHPNSTPIILGLDVTGSMGHLLQIMADKLGVTMGEIYKRKPVEDPQVLFAAIDDYITSDEEALQVTQFESDIRIAEQMTALRFLRRGGGNGWESYVLAWYFAAYHTKCDAFKKNKKGILITMGDDGVQPTLTRAEIKEVFGDDVEKDIKVDELLSAVNKNWEVFHLTMMEGGSASSSDVATWDTVLGSHHIKVEDSTKIPEIIVSILEKLNGKSTTDIVNSWDGSTALVVGKALEKLEITTTGADTGVVMF